MKRPKMSNIIYISAVLISILVLVLRWPKVQKEHEINKLQKEKIKLQEQVEVLDNELQELKDTWEMYCWENSILKASGDVIRDNISKLDYQIGWIDLKLIEILDIRQEKWDVEYMRLICEKAPKSPLCFDFDLLDKIKVIAYDRDIDWKLLIWITYAESHIGMNFAPHYWCEKSNNWAWLKWAKRDDWSISEKYDKQYTGLEGELRWYLSGCYLYAFDTTEDFFISLANTISLWYKSCKWEPECIVKSYVWKYSENWVNNVNVFLK